ncbi:hydratase [Cellvibrio zantedeschiae]|uniref:Hydratase n=1 Tax=Cellvibrio zantedeschiae TaxID=1237077 RepID=A0ABQ3BAE4_9GAMM|nr:hydratase [Cellvibrio zantedeschiae]GGY87993.1 hydratase [Cellvibrio zantedeschiae]
MSNAQEAAAILVERRQTGTQGDRLPESCRPTNIKQALDIQNAVTERWCELEDDSIGGWKCLLPPQDKIVVGPIYTRTIDSVAPVALWPKPGTTDIARIEPELAFFFGIDLPAREQPYTPAEVDAAISRTHLALELINCRYITPGDCTFPEMLADGLVNQGLFIGPQIDNALAQNASEFTLNVRQNSELSAHHAKHPNGNPKAPLYWLAEFLRSQGQGIVAGQAVITGSFAGVLEVPMNAEVSLEYVGLGRLDVSFTAKS